MFSKAFPYAKLTVDDISRIELELRFAEIRLQEIEAVSVRAPDNVIKAINGYEINTKMAIQKAEQARDSSSITTILEIVSLGIFHHISIKKTCSNSS